MQNNWEEFLIKGKIIETNFAQCLIKTLGGTVSKTDKWTDIKDHVDLIWELDRDTNGLKTYKIDVKGLKRNNRSEDFDENIHWIELQNVRGDTGWLYGKADMFAFETIDYWIIVGKNKLKQFVWEKIKPFQTQPFSKDFYHLYKRPQRQDIITKVKTLDLMAIASKILQK